jgi:phage shock protein A
MRTGAEDVRHVLAQAGTSELALGDLALEMERTVVQLRRETVAAVARQRQLREETSAARELVDEVESQASRALARGDALGARQILARGMCVLKSCEELDASLADANRCVSQLLSRLVRTEDQVRFAWRRKEDLARGGRGC